MGGLPSLYALCMPGRGPHLPTLVSAGGTVVRKVENTILDPARLRSIALLAKSSIDASFALLSFTREGVLLAFRLQLTSGAAVFHAAHPNLVFVAEVVPFRFDAGHHLGHHVLFEYIAVCQYI